jgi:hypothetical protein
MEAVMGTAFPVFMVPVVGTIAVFSFLAVARWSDARRKEREAYYRSETVKKIAETQGSGGGSALEYLREEERIGARRRREGQRLGGLITAAVGVALIAFLKFGIMNDPDAQNVYLVGLIPLFIGVALLVYSYLLAPQE